MLFWREIIEWYLLSLSKKFKILKCDEETENRFSLSITSACLLGTPWPITDAGATSGETSPSPKSLLVLYYYKT